MRHRRDEVNAGKLEEKKYERQGSFREHEVERNWA